MLVYSSSTSCRSEEDCPPRTWKNRAELNAPVVCTLQGEDFFLDNLPEKNREEAWSILRGCVEHVDAFIAVSRYYVDAPENGPEWGVRLFVTYVSEVTIRARGYISPNGATPSAMLFKACCIARMASS